MKKSILFVDDEANILEGYRRTLRNLREKYAIEYLSVPTDAANRIKQKRFDLVFTDLRMPSIDGLEMIRKVKASHPDCPVIVITGYGDVSTAVEAMKIGAVDYLQKPVEGTALLNRIESALGGGAVDGMTASPRAPRPPTNDLYCGHCGAKASPPPGTEIFTTFPCPSCGDALVVPLFLENLLLERRIERKGPFTVYKGYDLDEGVTCVVYAMDAAETAKKEKLMAMAVATANAVGALSHANIIPLRQHRVLGGTLYAVEPAVNGHLLSEYDFTSEPNDVDACFEVILQVAIALSVAHHRDISHHRICPDTIRIDSMGRPRLGEFFLSNMLFSIEYQERSNPSTPPHYISPERIETGFESQEGDVFGLGVLCYHMLSGVYPFHGANEIEIVHSRVAKHPKDQSLSQEKPSIILPQSVAYRPPLDVRALRPDIPPPVAEIVMAMLSPTPENRPRLSKFIDAILRVQAERNQKAEVFSATRRMVEKASTIQMPPPSKK